MDTWIVSILWLLWIVLLWTWVHKYLFETLLSVLFSIYSGGITGLYGNSIFNFLRKPYSGYTILRSLRVYRRFIFSTSSPALVIFWFCCCVCEVDLFFCFLMVAILMSVRWYLIGVLIGISIMISDVSIFSCG